MDFVDRILKCSDCGNDFIFTAGEQLFFLDRQFKNDPKRCKLCKAKRAGLGRIASGLVEDARLPLSRTETRTDCSACGLETTVPFKPTQGRPVFCRSCFQTQRAPSGPQQAAAGQTHAGQTHAARATMESIAEIPIAVLHPSGLPAPGEFQPGFEVPLFEVPLEARFEMRFEAPENMAEAP